MRVHLFLIAVILVLAIFFGCDEETSEEIANSINSGEIQGVIANEETREPIEGAMVTIGEAVALTDAGGKYSLKDILFSEDMEIAVAAENYEGCKDSISLHQELLFINIDLLPVDSQSAVILELLRDFSGDIAALDPDRIPSIQDCLSEDYAASEDIVTLIGVKAGVVPTNYDELPDTILTIIDKYSELEFEFADPRVKFDGDLAVVNMRFEVYAETKAQPPIPAKKWEIIIDGELNFREQDGDWKLFYWQLIPPFHKFLEEPLE